MEVSDECANTSTPTSKSYILPKPVVAWNSVLDNPTEVPMVHETRDTLRPSKMNKHAQLYLHQTTGFSRSNPYKRLIIRL